MLEEFEWNLMPLPEVDRIVVGKPNSAFAVLPGQSLEREIIAAVGEATISSDPDAPLPKMSNCVGPLLSLLLRRRRHDRFAL
jgi:hypothetical protein